MLSLLLHTTHPQQVIVHASARLTSLLCLAPITEQATYDPRTYFSCIYSFLFSVASLQPRPLCRASQPRAAHICALCEVRTCQSTAYPSRIRAFICSNAVVACLSKLSKWLILSLLKNGLVIERWNFHSSSVQMFLTFSTSLVPLKLSTHRRH